MDRATLLALNAINRRFYRAIAREWSEKRAYAWPGFARIVDAVANLPAADGGGPLRVLDLGCGDGRFAQYLAAHVPGPVAYLGIDFNDELLARARARGLGETYRFASHDLVAPADASAHLPPSAAGELDLICLLGVLHHVPGRATRESLLRELASRLSLRGLLALTFWQLPEDPRFGSRVIELEDYNARAEQPVASEQLEPGDTLLRWGDRGAPPRYCHFPDATETQQLLAATGLRVRERYRADGRGEQLNEYALLTR
jgi:SAM-dependent methyltransferase